MKLPIIIFSVAIVGVAAFAVWEQFRGPDSTSLVTTTPPGSGTQDPTFTLAVTSPKVFLKNSSELKLEEVSGSVVAVEGAQIITSVTGRASLLYPNGTISAIDTNSEIRITTATDQGNRSAIRLIGGGLFSKIKKVLGVGDSYEVRTNNVVASVRGTFFASQFKNKVSTIFGIQNKVKVVVLDRQGNPIAASAVEVGSGFKAVVKEGDTKITVAPMTEEDFKNPLIAFHLQNLDQNDRSDPEIKILLNRIKLTATSSPTPKPMVASTPTPTPTLTLTPIPTPTPTPNTNPTLDFIVPSNVTGGTEFTLNGSNFIVERNIKQVSTVLLNATSVTFSIIDPQTIFATAQVQSGVYDVSIVTTTGQKLTLKGALTVK